MLHCLIVFMCINSKILNLLFGKINRFLKHPFYLSISCNAMNRSIRLIIQPLSVFNITIIRVVSNYKSKNTIDHLIIAANIKLAFIDIFLKVFLSRVNPCPLRYISTFFHILLRYFYNCKNIFHIFFIRQSYHFIFSSKPSSKTLLSFLYKLFYRICQQSTYQIGTEVFGIIFQTLPVCYLFILFDKIPFQPVRDSCTDSI